MAELRPALRRPVRAVHVHHGLQNEADAWADFCKRLCEQHDIALDILDISVVRQQRESLEAAARRLRYNAIAKRLESGEALVTAHHLDDQAETLLLHLIKGAGTDGLAAMPRLREFSSGFLLRPLLAFRRQALVDFLLAREVPWIEDPSNSDIRFDRNYLRKIILPQIEARWPAASRSIARSANLQGMQRQLNDDLARIDLQQCYEVVSGALVVPDLLRLSTPRRQLLLRFWLRSHAPVIHLSLDQLTRLDQLIQQSGKQGKCLFQVGDYALRQFRERLYKLPLASEAQIDPISWKLDGVLQIPALNLYLEPSQILRLLSWLTAADALLVRPRQGGETLILPGRGHRSLKRMMQEWGIPAWQRWRIPLLWHDDRVVCVPGYWVAASP